jgi:hypothetical protein
MAVSTYCSEHSLTTQFLANSEFSEQNSIAFPKATARVGPVPFQDWPFALCTTHSQLALALKLKVAIDTANKNLIVFIPVFSFLRLSLLGAQLTEFHPHSRLNQIKL